MVFLLNRDYARNITVIICIVVVLVFYYENKLIACRDSPSKSRNEEDNLRVGICATNSNISDVDLPQYQHEETLPFPSPSFLELINTDVRDANLTNTFRSLLPTYYTNTSEFISTCKLRKIIASNIYKMKQAIHLDVHKTFVLTSKKMARRPEFFCLLTMTSPILHVLTSGAVR